MNANVLVFHRRKRLFKTAKR